MMLSRTQRILLGLTNVLWLTCPGKTGTAWALPESSTASASLLPPSIAQEPFSKFEKAEHVRAFNELRHSMQGCWSGSMSVQSLQPHNQIQVKQKPVLNFRLHVNLKGNAGSWTVWNLLGEGDETVVPLRCTPLERTWQCKVAFPGSIIRIPCAITNELPKITRDL